LMRYGQSDQRTHLGEREGGRTPELRNSRIKVCALRFPEASKPCRPALSCWHMGLFYVGCKVINPRTAKSVVVPKMMVDAGAESTWIDGCVLAKIGIEPRKKDLQFQMANGQIITRSVGYAVLKVDKVETVDEIVFAQKGDLQLLGARALEGLNLRVDSRRKKLVAAGPIVVAAAVPPRFGELIRVPLQEPERAHKASKKTPKKDRRDQKAKAKK
jgi:predicted aspartyl protease